jgi:hypothetical protein
MCVAVAVNVLYDMPAYHHDGRDAACCAIAVLAWMADGIDRTDGTDGIDGTDGTDTIENLDGTDGPSKPLVDIIYQPLQSNDPCIRYLSEAFPCFRVTGRLKLMVLTLPLRIQLSKIPYWSHWCD